MLAAAAAVVVGAAVAAVAAVVAAANAVVHCYVPIFTLFVLFLLLKPLIVIS